MDIPKPESRIYQEHCVEICEQICPEGWVVVDTYYPTSSITPWDYYGGRHQREYMTVLKAAGITPLPLLKHQKHLAPMGTGPGGMVRFGDNMLPSIYMIAVPAAEEAASLVAFDEHKKAIHAWIHENGTMPEACR